MTWTLQRMLIWGQTYPELSTKYVETVCTGAVLLDSPGLLRIYPIDYRYLPQDKCPKKWDIVSARIQKNSSDSRPESYKVDASSIKVEGHIDTKDGWADRRRVMLRPDYIFSGLEEIEERQRETGLSLGIVRPVRVLDAYLKLVSRQEQQEFRMKYDWVKQQRELWHPGESPVPLPRFKPRVVFRCEGDSKEYDRVILDWEVVEGAKHHFDLPDRSKAFRHFMMTRAFSKNHDPFLILGNIFTHPQEFVVVNVFYPQRRAQMSLFG